MRKVLLVSPHFPPVNAPDMQRVRLALPYLRENGWEPVVLAVTPDSVEGAALDPLLEATYPSDIRVVRVAGLTPRLTRWAGVGSLWWRCGRALRQAGDALLATERFDAVFFSTTQCDAFKLGPRWRACFGVPYVLDYQDPWVNDYYERTGARPPGGRIKYAFAQWRARRAEPVVLRDAASVVSVSSAYAAMLQRLYPWFDPRHVRLLPFGASEADFMVAEHHRPARPLIPFGDGNVHLVYAGRCGDDMAYALSVLFRALRRYRTSHPDEAARLRLHFIGTDYAPPPLGCDRVLPLAEAQGVGDLVAEHRYRVPYFDALYYLRQADALLAVGSDDPSYAASKIFPYLLARRPLLMLYHEDSLVLQCAAAAGAGVRFAFNAQSDPAPLAAAVWRDWFVAVAHRRPAEFDARGFAPYTARELTRELAGILVAAADTVRR
jgi:hypothetical protein